MGENGLKLVNDKFSFDNYIDDLEKMFSTVIAETTRQQNYAADIGAVADIPARSALA